MSSQNEVLFFKNIITLSKFISSNLNKDYNKILYSNNRKIEKYKNIQIKNTNNPKTENFITQIFMFLFKYSNRKQSPKIQISNSDLDKKIQAIIISNKNIKKSISRNKIIYQKIEIIIEPTKPINSVIKSELEQLYNRLRFLKDTYGHPNMPMYKTLNNLEDIISIFQKTIKNWNQNEFKTNSLNSTAKDMPFIKAQAKSKGNKINDVRQNNLFLQGGTSNSTLSNAERIWLPVSSSRRYEMLKKGAHEDYSNGIKRGSHLWIQIKDIPNFENVVPLAFRKTLPKLEWPPIQRNAVGQNLWQVFDKETWNHIRFNSYDRWGHRCQLCGKQFGSLWSKIATEKELEHPGPVDCHEVWEWSRIEGTDIGIQKLKEVMVVCKDCHATFHEGRTLKLAKEKGIEQKAEKYINKLRKLTTHMSDEQLQESLNRTRENWNDLKDINKWVIDLSVLAQQNFMQGHNMILKLDNVAGVEPDMILGTEFKTDDGKSYPVQTIKNYLSNNNSSELLL